MENKNTSRVVIGVLVVLVVLTLILGGITQLLARLATMIFMLLTSMQILVAMVLFSMGRVNQQLILTI